MNIEGFFVGRSWNFQSVLFARGDKTNLIALFILPFRPSCMEASASGKYQAIAVHKSCAISKLTMQISAISASVVVFESTTCANMVDVHALNPLPVPLSMDDDGTIRVTSTRITLDTIIAAFDAGATPEEIVQRYTTLDIAGVYAVIGYVLANRDSINQYLAGRTTEAAKLKDEVEKLFPSAGTRQKLESRRRKA